MDSSNDHVTVDILPQIDELHEIENELETSPQEYNVMDTRTASQNQSSDEKIVESMTSSPQDEVEHGSFEEKEEHVTSLPYEDQADDPMINEDLEKLYILTRRNDWNTTYQDIFKEAPIENSKYLTARISKKEDTALHVAIETQSFTFAEKLIKYMKREDLAIKNRDGNTPFFLVAASKKVRLARQMFEKNDELPNIHGANQMLPIQVAAQQGHKPMVEFLTKIQGSLEEMDNNKSAAIASKIRSSEEIVENMASHPLTNQAGGEAGGGSGDDGGFGAGGGVDGAVGGGADGCVGGGGVAGGEGGGGIGGGSGHGGGFTVGGSEEEEKRSRREVAKEKVEKRGKSTAANLLGNILMEIDRFNKAFIEKENASMFNLSNAAIHNDWNKAYTDIFKRDPYKNSKYLTAKISENGNTALHLAVKNNSVEFVKELIKYMLKEELAITNNDGDTGFLLAAGNGSMEIVNAMFEKNRQLPSIRGYSNDLPIHRAAKLGHKEMVEFFYGIQGPLQEIDSSKLFLNWMNELSLSE